MNFMKSRIDRPPEPLPRPQIFRHIDTRPSTSRNPNNGTNRSIHGTTLNETLAQNEPYVVCAVAEGRGHAALEIGLAAIDVSAAPALKMTQFSDNFWYSNILTSLTALQPNVIFFSDHSLNTRSSELPGLIRQHLTGVQVASLPRCFFNDCNAEKYMDELCSESYRTLKDAVHCKYYGLAAVGAVLRHCVESNLLRIASRSLQFIYLNKKDTMAIEVECVTHLEMIYSLQNMQDKQSLYRFLNHCITGVGKRHLRANLLEPSSNQQLLESRLMCIGELLVKTDLLGGIQRILRDFVNVGGLMKLSMEVDSSKTSKQNTIHLLNQARSLRNALRCVPELVALLEDAESSLLLTIRRALSNDIYKELYDKICTVLDSESSGSTYETADYYRLFLVKTGVSSALDILRRLYSEVIDEIREYVADLTRELRILLKMSFTKAHGFHIQVSLKEANPIIPPIFKVLSRNGNRISLTTSALDASNVRIDGINREIESISYAVVRELIVRIRGDIQAVYVLVAHVTDLDIIQSLAVVSQEKEYCRPNFGRSTKIVAARHPLLEAYGEVEKVVRNNVISTPEYNVFIVTGPNMSGKTVYMKTICLVQILAQLGCYVPATKAEFRITDRLMAVFGAAESVEYDISNSTRMAKKMEAVCQSMTVDSLIIIDELFGDTQCPDINGPTWKLLERIVSFIGFQANAACESLSAIRRPFVYLTTHCHDMLRPLEHLHNVSRLCLQTETLSVEGRDRLRYKYTVTEGKTSVKNYGIALARNIRFPESVIARAEQINEEIRNESAIGQFAAHNSTLADETLSTQANLQCFDKRLYDLYARIASVLATADTSNGDNNNPEMIGEHLQSILESFCNALPPEAARYLQETSLEELLLRRTDETVPDDSPSRASSVGSIIAAESDPEQPEEVVDHFEIDETMAESEDWFTFD